MNGRKRDVLPVRIWAEDCSITATLDWNNYSRNGKSGSAYIPVYLRPVIYCDLLEQEGRYIKEVLAETFIADYAKELLKDYRQWTLESTIKSIRNKHTEFNKEYDRTKTKIDVLTERLESDTYSSLTQEWLEDHEATLVDKQLTEKLNDVKELKSNELNWRNKMVDQQRLTEKYSYLKDTLTKDFKKKKIDIDKVLKGTCPTCGSEVAIDETKKLNLSKEIEEIIDKGKAAAAEEEREEKKLAVVTTQYELAKDALASATKNVNPLATSIEGYKERVVVYRERLLEVNKMLEHREKLVNDLIELNKHPILDAYKHIGPKGSINNKLSEEINKGFKGYEMVLFEDSSRSNESKAVFKVFHNGIEYKQLSKSEQLTANIMLSNTILTKLGSSLPLLIDDFESFSTINKTILVKLLNKSSREYIIAEVKGKKLEVTAK